MRPAAEVALAGPGTRGWRGPDTGMPWANPSDGRQAPAPQHDWSVSLSETPRRRRHAGRTAPITKRRRDSPTASSLGRGPAHVDDLPDAPFPRSITPPGHR